MKRLNIYNVAGVELKLHKGSNGSFCIDNKVPGIYFLELFDDKGNRYIKKLIVH